MNFEILAEITKIIMGQSPPSSSYNREGQGLPFFQGKADFGDLYPKARVFCTKPQKVAEAGDILISVRAPVGPTNINPGKSCVGRGLAALHCSKRINNYYLLYFLRSYEKKLAQVSMGSTFDAISKDDLENILVPLPSPNEQKRIATILQKADRLRHLRRYALEASSTYLQSVFLEMFGDPGKNPKNWQTGQLHQLCSKIVDCPHSTPTYSPTITGHACIRSSDIQNGTLDWSTTKYVDFSEYEKRVQTLIPMPNDVVYCREGARFGNAAIIPKGKKLCLGQRMMLFRAASSIATPEFIWAFLESESTYRQACQSAGGSASPHLNVGDIKEFITIIPPIARQQEFAQIVQRYERLHAQQKEAERQADHLFQTLLHQAFQREPISDLVEVPVSLIEIDRHQENGHVGAPEDIDLAAYQLALPLE